jgi:hypothetical protein
LCFGGGSGYDRVMDTPPVPPQKKGLGVLAWLGMGCGALIVLVIIAAVLATTVFAPKLKQMGQGFKESVKQMGEDFQKDPTRATAMLTIKASMGQLEMAKEDEANKRYTLRQKSNGQLMTIYWDAKKQAPVTVQGDFSAIPPDANPPATPVPK